MSIVKENDLTEGLSGKFGRKIVFRVNKSGVTQATRRSTKPRTANEAQIAQQERWKRATQYAKAKMQDAIAKAAYKKMAGDKPFVTAFSAAVRDYLVPPEVLEILAGDFTGAAGSTIPVKVSDNAKVMRVTVAILGVNGAVVESGDATYTPGAIEWTYVTKQVLPVLAGSKIVVTAIDRPGNEAILEKLL